MSNTWHNRLILSRLRAIFLVLSPILAIFFYAPQGFAQSRNPVPSQSPELPAPTPLTPQEQPIETPSTEETTPSEGVPDIPGEFTFESFEFVGGTVFKEEELQAATAEFIGQPISFAQLLQAVNRITELYLQQGYITSGAYIPEQQLESDSLKIQIVESSLADININITQGRLKEKYIRDRISRATSTPLNINKLQEALQLLQLNPLIDNINAELASGNKRGTNILDITVNGAKTFGFQAILNNNRNPSVGSVQRGVEISEDNLFGIGDGISLTYLNTDGSDEFEVGYTLPINSRDGSLGFNFRNIDSEIVEDPFDDLDIEINSRDFDFTYRQPILQKATENSTQELALSLTASRRESDGQLLGRDFPISIGADREGETRLSVLRFAQEWQQRSRQTFLAARSQFSLGIDAFDATVNDNGEADSQFFAWRGQILWLRLLKTPKNNSQVGTSLVVKSDFQLATDSLVSLENFGLGGQASVRGYRQDVLLSDSGILASAELRVPILQVSQVQGSLQITPFIDLGTVWNIERPDPETNTLVGTGVGLLWQQSDNLTARLDWGIPLVDIDSGDNTWQENGVYFQLNYNLKLF
ncbi:ShlB/FhaC/HecB family hemolysin secretion/activation protein [Pleurocapsa sp. PCC 7319]|uniref:ShlB/FhaC/HecB family hemolysin secretion/activation protein n=1 Tax=Pleurocapsa sp. PCC 7319 TaxID=118161 RepID=UPI00034CFB13|nr:ShlB/FhaC/HecB family hemolysin secretion/activation protein [Pleurocapsa sp. PCC 7319]